MEEEFSQYRMKLKYLAEICFEEYKDVSLSIIIRQDLKDLIKDEKILLSLQQFKDDQYWENPFLDKDSLNPTEEVCLDFQKGGLINIRDFNMKEKDIVFLDKVDDRFRQSMDKLLLSENIGFDSEFKCTESKFDEKGVSILQLASDDICVILDVLKLNNEKEFQKYLIELFSNQKFKKIGHSIKQDLHQMNINLNINCEMNNFQDIAEINKDLFGLSHCVSLAYMTEVILKKKMSKAEQVSNWNRRPLRQCQIHYAALDAIICLKIYQQLLENPNIQKECKFNLPKNHKNAKINQGQKIPEGEKKFIVDSMLCKLAKYMRNSGIDTEYVEGMDSYSLLTRAVNEKRIVITADNKMNIANKKFGAYIYLIYQAKKTEEEFQKILQHFSIDTSSLEILSRCVKCNGINLQDISADEAQKYIVFKHKESYYELEYWQCFDCKQVYWEGNKFKQSQQRFQNLLQQ